MRNSSSSKSVLPATWTSVLERIQHALQQAIAGVGTRQEALEPAGKESGAEHESTCERLIEKLKTSGTDQSHPAGHVMEPLENATANPTEEALQRWLAVVSQAAQKLADRATRRV
jgi:hypothetical protein